MKTTSQINALVVHFQFSNEIHVKCQSLDQIFENTV